MAVSTRLRPGLTMLGGGFATVVLALDDVAPDLVGLAVVVPVLLGFGVLEIAGRYRGRYGAVGRAGVLLTTCGLGFLLIVGLLYAVLPAGLLLVPVLAPPGVAGLAALAIGSALLAAALRGLDVVGTPTAVLLGLGVPAVPVVGALLAAVVGPTPLLGPGVAPGLSGAPYGLGWILVGHRLRRTSPAAGTDGARPAVLERSPHVAVAAVVGGALVALSVGRFVPLGPLSSTPWVGHRLALDLSHLLLGAAGLAVAVRGDARMARGYARAAGLIVLALVALNLVAMTGGGPWIGWLAGDLLDLNLPDAIVHLPAGVVLVVVGYGVDGSGRPAPRPERAGRD